MRCSVVFFFEAFCHKHFVVFSRNQHRRLLPAMRHNLRDGCRAVHNTLPVVALTAGTKARRRLRIAIYAYLIYTFDVFVWKSYSLQNTLLVRSVCTKSIHLKAWRETLSQSEFTCRWRRDSSPNWLVSDWRSSLMAATSSRVTSPSRDLLNQPFRVHNSNQTHWGRG